MNQKLKVTPKTDGAVISIDSFNIIIAVKPSAVAPKVASTVPVPPRIIVESVRSRLVEHIEELDVSEEADSIIVKPYDYLGREKFASIAIIIEELGGSYISAGRESKFLIPKDRRERMT